MITWVENEEISIYSDIEPKTDVQKVLPIDSKEEAKKKKAKPYINRKRVMFTVIHRGDQYCFIIPNKYCWDGASIPTGFRWLIGAKGSPEFLNPSMVHDYLCENHKLVAHNRELSSLIFKYLLMASGVGKVRAQVMYVAVNEFQKLCGWHV